MRAREKQAKRSIGQRLFSPSFVNPQRYEPEGVLFADRTGQEFCSSRSGGGSAQRCAPVNASLLSLFGGAQLKAAANAAGWGVVT